MLHITPVIFLLHGSVSNHICMANKAHQGSRDMKKQQRMIPAESLYDIFPLAPPAHSLWILCLPLFLQDFGDKMFH